MKRFLLLALALSCAACNGARSESSQGPAPSASSAVVPSVEVVPVVSKPLDTTIQLEGEIAPYERVAIFALHALHRDSAARARANAYLANFPRGIYAGPLRRVLGSMP